MDSGKRMDVQMSNAERTLITDYSLDENNPHITCSYVRAYFKAKGLRVGDYWIAHEYMAWIGQKHHDFQTKVIKRTEFGLFGYSETERKLFEEYIFRD